MKLSTLKKQAQKTTSARGHRMKWRQAFGRADGPKSQIAICKCGCAVLILEKTAPNQIEIGGDALAINCK